MSEEIRRNKTFASVNYITSTLPELECDEHSAVSNLLDYFGNGFFLIYQDQGFPHYTLSKAFEENSSRLQQSMPSMTVKDLVSQQNTLRKLKSAVTFIIYPSREPKASHTACVMVFSDAG